MSRARWMGEREVERVLSNSLIQAKSYKNRNGDKV